MRVNGISGTNTQVGQMGLSHASDSYSKNIKNQIASAQEKLKELSSNKEISLEEKMKKRQEIQKQIAELNNQLRQHEMEQIKQQRQEKRSSTEDAQGGNGKTRAGKSGKKGRGLSQASMKALISAGSAMGQIHAGQQISTQIEGQANVLKAEVKQDKRAGIDTQAKEEELAGLEENLAKAQASQMEILGKANEEMRGASQAEENTDKEAEKKTETSRTKQAAGQESEASQVFGENNGKTLSVESEAVPSAEEKFS
ncbi:MAG: FlxA-like family protein [Roseburia sp.]|nr:FlxA-like family protein [Roseburia sp.]